MPRKKARWVVHGTHPTTYQTHVLWREGTAGWDTYQTFVDLGYLGVMISDADFYVGPKFEDPWATMRTKGEIVEVKA